jgi:hypothetical protein
MPAGDRSAKTAMFSESPRAIPPTRPELETAVAPDHLLDFMPHYEVIWDASPSVVTGSRPWTAAS